MRLLTGAVVLALLALACQAPSSTAPAAPTAASGGTAQTAAAATAPTNQTPEIARLIAAARAAGENTLDLSWSQNTVGGTDGAKQLADLVNRTYGLNISVSFTPGPSMTNMAGKVVQETAASQKASTDILLGSESNFAPLTHQPALESYDYTQLSPRVQSDFLAPDNIGVEFASRVPGISYNTSLVPPQDVPQTLEAALDPRWKGKIASTIDAGSFVVLATRPEWGAPRVTTYVRQLSQQVGGLVRCGETDRLISGEFSMLVMDCGSYETRRQAAQGAPLGEVIPSDAATVGFWYMGVPLTSAHPNLAKLFIGAILSEEGQRIEYSLDYTDNYALPGSQSVAEVDALRAQGVEPLKVDVQFVLSHPEDEALATDVAKIFQQGAGG